MTVKALQRALQQRIPNASLCKTSLPLCPSIQLWLLNPDYPQWALDPRDAAALMDEPPYWSFCWASGQVLARYLLDNPALVRDKTLVDFGAGSGVVAIAAKQAGAAVCWALDSDPLALAACAVNANLNQVSLCYASDLDQLPPADIVTLADVFYDADNLPLLAQLKPEFELQIIADSRRKASDFKNFTAHSSVRSHTVPDLDESSEFRQVTIYTQAWPTQR